MKRAGIYNIEEVLPYTIFKGESEIKLLKKETKNDTYGERVYNGHSVKMYSQRYQLFSKKGIECSKCGIEGMFFALERNNDTPRFHFNLYGINEQRNEVLITKDHNTPKSKGGKNHISNYSVMCEKCNGLKGDKMVERKLVTIRKISDIVPIERADNIELAKIDGWQCVVRKGEFSKGDLGVYFEIDSFLPIEERYEFLRKSSYRKLPDGTEGFRLRTIKLRKQLSQGLLLPINTFQELKEAKEGDDVTELLKIQKYEPPVPPQLSGIVKGMFPGFIQKSDQERIQNLPEYFSDYNDVEFEETEKVDGASVTYYYNNEEFGVCSRNLELKEDDKNTMWQIARDIKIEEALAKLGKNIAIQGELIGEGIQKNPLKIKGKEYRVFDIYDIDNKRYMTPDGRADLIKSSFPTLKTVTILDSKIKIFQLCNTMEKMLEYAKGSTMTGDDPAKNLNIKREGVIFKSHSIVGGNTVSFKVINNDYLMEDA